MRKKNTPGGTAGRGGINPAPRAEEMSVRAAAEQLLMVPIRDLVPYDGNARTHSQEQIDLLRRSMREFGFVAPVLIDFDNNIIAGHGRVEAAKAEGMEEVPCVLVSNLTDAQRRAYILAENRLAELSGWDGERLRLEMEQLAALRFDTALIGFDMPAPPPLQFGPEDAPELDKEEKKPAPAVKPSALRVGPDIQLYHGDCLELLKDIPDGSVDMILCDLPYGTTDCEWDLIIPIEPLWKQYRRIIKSNGVIALFGSEPFSTKLRVAAFDLYKYDWIWVKNTVTGFQHAKNMPMKNHEIISVFSLGSMGHESLLGEHRMEYNPQGITELNKERSGVLRKHGGIIGKRPSHKDRYIQQSENYPKSVLIFESVAIREHPTQKPVALLEYLIKTYTNEGETVLDNTMGSGSTGVAAVHTGRRFIGMELDAGYFETAKKRIEEARRGGDGNAGTETAHGPDRSQGKKAPEQNGGGGAAEP